MATTKKFYILTGEPGVGKTTLVKKLVASLSNYNVKTSGFYTEEVLGNSSREGFDVVSLDGARGRLARDEMLLNVPVKQKVGKYSVLVQEFEAIAMPSLEKKNDITPQVLVIDEIGKMEFFSAPFKAIIQNIFNEKSNNIVLATIPLRKSDPLIEKIRNSEATKLWTVTRENRNNIQENIIKEMKMDLMIL